MKNVKFFGGSLLIAAAVIFVLLALFSPNNGMFTALWDIGIFTLRGEASLMIIYLVSALSLLVGLYLVVMHIKNNKEDV